MRRSRLALQIGVVLTAAALLLVPLPSHLVEQYYADWAYPTIQARLTSWSNTSRISLFDVLLIVAGGAMLLVWFSSLRLTLRMRRLWPLTRTAVFSTVFAAVVYLWFAAAWGLNYARAPLEVSIGYDSERVTHARLRALADRTTGELNRLHAKAHAIGFPEVGEVPPALVTALHEIERQLGRPVPTTPGRPKATLLAPFFRASGVDGMHAPFLLETLINPSLTPPEVPAVLAHEWAHLAGYAPEADASFVGLLTALGADAPSQYSAWLALFDHAVGQLPRAEQRDFVTRLAAGPTADRRAIAERFEARVEVVARASWQTYDQYLKSQGVREGVQSYSRVVELLLASGALERS